MDKKNWIAIVVCLGLIVAYPAIINYFYPPVPLPPRAVTPAPVTGTGQPATSPTQQPVIPSTASGQPTLQASTPQTLESIEPGLVSENLVALENDFIRAELTTHGGAIKQVILKKHFAIHDEPVILNIAGPTPILNLRGWLGSFGVSGYTLQSQSPTSVTFNRALTPTLTLQRTYTLTGDYSIALSQTVTNTGTKLEVLSPYSLDLGSATSVYKASSERTMMGLSWYNSGGDYHTHKIHEFDAANIPLVGIQLWAGKSLIESKPEEEINWAALKSQFFVLIVNPVDFSAQKVEGIRRFYPELREKNQAIPDGVVASLVVPGVQVEAGSSFTQRFDVYAGPKENSRLVLMPDEEARVMEFGMFGMVSRTLLWIMNHIYDLVKSYGWAIVILTIIIKGVLWYPQGMANRSMKRMATVAPVLKEMQDKFKDKPEKLNEEMIKIYKDYGVNPVGGCLPMLLQFPIFLGFYSMLQTTIELRHQSFFWITDLAQPDTVLTIPIFGYDFPLNPMPLIMAASMYWSMHVTPQPAGVDNPMLKIMKFMPLMFLAFCYNFSAALSLYWTVQNLLTILQLYYNLHFQKDITLEQMKAQVLAKKKSKKKKI